MIHHYKDETFLLPLWRKILGLPPKLILSWIQNISRFCFHIFTYISSYKHMYFEMWIAYSLSVQFSGSVLSDPLGPHGLQHARLPCPSPNPRACSNSCPLRWWWWYCFLFNRCLYTQPRRSIANKTLGFCLINFYWIIVALQCRVSFCCTAKWTSYMHTYIPSFGFPSHLGQQRALNRVPWALQEALSGRLFYS